MGLSMLVSAPLVYMYYCWSQLYGATVSVNTSLADDSWDRNLQTLKPAMVFHDCSEMNEKIDVGSRH